MKKIKIIILAITVIILVFGLCSCTNGNDELAALRTQLSQANTQISSLQSALDEANVYKPEYFIDWVENDSQIWRTVMYGSFLTDAASAPTQNDIQAILHYASLAPTSNGNADYFLIAVTDPDEQRNIIGEDYGAVTSSGTVTILVLSDRLYNSTVRADGGTVACQPDRGYYDAGIVSGYLNTAALSLGYGTRFFMSISLPKDNGQFDSGAIGYDVLKYAESFQYENGSTGEMVNVCGNCKFVCAIVIGTVNLQAGAGVTDTAYPDNWSIWIPPQEAQK